MVGVGAHAVPAHIVHMSSYAPLFANYAYTQWNPDLIGYDQTSSFGSTSKGVFSYLVPANSLTVVRVAR